MRRVLAHPSRESFDLAQVLSALADPVRLDMVRSIAASESDLDCSALAAGADVSASTISHHAQVLRAAGITMTEAEGRHRYVTLRRDDMEARFPGLFEAVLKAHVTAPARGVSRGMASGAASD